MIVKRKLNTFQLSLLLLHAQIGVGMITLVTDVYFKAGVDSWISIIVAGSFIQILILLFSLLFRRFPGKNFFQILEIVFGKWIGKFSTILLCIYFIMISAILISKYIVILKSWLLPLTPKWILILILMLITIYVAKENLHVITRFYFLALFVVYIFFGFVIYSLKDANITYILPIANNGIFPILKGSQIASYSFQGFEYLLFLAPYTLASNRRIIVTASVTNWFITFFYMFVVLANQLFFSGEEIKLITEPIFYLVKSISFQIIERPDLIFTSLWIVLVITSTVILFYIISLGLSTVLNTAKRTPFLYISTAISFLISLFLYGEERINNVTDKFHVFILFFSAVFPLLVLVISRLMKRTGETK